MDYYTKILTKNWEEFEEEQNNYLEKEYYAQESNCAIQEFDVIQQFTTNELFDTREALIGWAKKIGKQNGIVIVIKSSESRGPGKRPRVHLACERSGKYRPSKRKEEIIGELKRKCTGSKKCDCPFELLGMKFEQWELKVVCGLHNHALAVQLEGHSYAGRLIEKEKVILKTMSENLVKPRNILMSLKADDENNVTTIKTIYNARQRYKLIEKDGRSQMQQLMKKLR
ncbi:uncharacterized protein LOC127802167 [Diospyros lotus]|uniref:uncharacterized protein LOC127802167 n=1 Tax=Diospyros lotus TaxID=55363 RepID=UPI0022513098|nr:uncharacterized protein LOC127802167 [Diospyros lotus]